MLELDLYCIQAMVDVSDQTGDGQAMSIQKQLRQAYSSTNEVTKAMARVQASKY